MPGVFTPSEVHLDETLTNLSIAHMQSADNFIAPRVFPNIGVEKQSDRYYVWDRDFYNRIGEVELAAPGTESPEISMSVSQDTYYIDPYHLGASFSDQMLANEDTMLNVRSTAANTIVNKFMLKRELDWIESFFAPSVWSTEYAGVAATPSTGEVFHWSDYSNSTPIIDVRNAKRAMWLASSGTSQYNDTVMVMTKDVEDKLLDHPDILARMNTGVTPSNPALADRQLLAQILGVSEILVIEAIQNTAKEGQTKSESFVATKKAALYSRPRAAGLAVASAGYTFTWNGLRNNSGLGLSVLSYDNDYLRMKKIAEKIEVYAGWDMKVTSADLGVFFNTIIA